MRISDWSSDVCSSDLLFIAILIALAKPMGLWLFTLYEGRSTPLHRLLGPVERGFYRLAGIDPGAEQGWRRYALHMLLFNFALALFTYAILRLRSEEHTSELQSLMRISYAVLCLQKHNNNQIRYTLHDTPQ